ncbi:MAG: hypothetical protein PWR03_142 [Tenuifilum sp.]|jgi:hypothetical protein|uniref:hypothetical protein n=1 Tax=Tenuifilum sp. TaxID=2760880 RepID=UPI0024ABF9CD|nr:hypothetical protein [Tenuifilum sp.]MDI3525959.1 hypothetical protein [Tenuifilum sp.]
MNIIETKHRLEYLDFLLRSGNTGTAAERASKQGNSESIWGWRVTNVSYVKLEGANHGTIIVSYQYYNIWGNPTDKYKELYD